MKRRVFISHLLWDGRILLRSGSCHDSHRNPKAGPKQPVPRHTEIEYDVARHIRKYL
jgi:hypothetical protein